MMDGCVAIAHQSHALLDCSKCQFYCAFFKSACSSFIPHLYTCKTFTGNRVVIAYRNGLIILWGLHETQVLAVLGGTKRQRDTLAEYAASLHESSSFTEKSAEAQASSLSEQLHFPPPKSPMTTWPEIEDDEKEICSVCWACGNIFVAGYVDGDIQFWSFPNENKIQGQQQPESPRPSSASGVVPLRKIDLAPGKTARMPVMVLRWWDSAKSSGKHGGGQLYVYGGGEVGAPEVLKVGSSLSHTTFLQNSFHNSFPVY